MFVLIEYFTDSSDVVYAEPIQASRSAVALMKFANNLISSDDEIQWRQSTVSTRVGEPISDSRWWVIKEIDEIPSV